MSGQPAQPVYLDNNATTRVDPRVVEAMLPYFTQYFGNPSSKYALGGHAAMAVKRAREQLQRLLGIAHAHELMFTSGGTESTNAAIMAALEASPRRREIITSAVEHPAVLSLCAWLEKNKGIRVHLIPVDRHGRLDIVAYRAALSDRVAVVSLMWANNETGVINPVADLAELAKEYGALFHTDAVQAVGKMPIDLQSTAIDMASLSGHKLHAPKGVGALYIRNGVRFKPQIKGGHQERGRRAGTENVPGIVGLGMAAELAADHLADEDIRVRGLRDRLERGILEQVADCVAVGARAERLPNTSNIAFSFIESESIVMLLDRAGVAVSMGSACSTGSFEPSHVLVAMQVANDAVRGGVRFSLSRDTTDDDIDRALVVIPGVIARLREISPFGTQEGASATLDQAHV
ncbi:MULTISPECIES: cysteine desulfurase NifS [Rhodopseudomonas]|uniref:Cysteine desulfurase n=1 Tax=Rhodopseudomonas palustris TaxID=1076 RepID=A0A0D7E457_RHOPL|nr:MULTISPECIES: cysteine desulfurase NifS [Rhodopseudomonas]KIZ35296.1 cysteine desulfurase [Rhodopseudomonas palustris]MDF3809069.1 cysteine desulfurase NifS [Rhodopseudomonas sp. BAL398]WOK15860.1 cysteine desulfurase NifS [Rhodopseudomonas sp. BAL398]